MVQYSCIGFLIKFRHRNFKIRNDTADCAVRCARALCWCDGSSVLTRWCSLYERRTWSVFCACRLVDVLLYFALCVLFCVSVYVMLMMINRRSNILYIIFSVEYWILQRRSHNKSCDIQLWFIETDIQKIEELPLLHSPYTSKYLFGPIRRSGW